jgi:hypothetical protein
MRRDVGELLARSEDSIAEGACFRAVPDLNTKEGLRPEVGRGKLLGAAPSLTRYATSR